MILAASAVSSFPLPPPPEEISPPTDRDSVTDQSSYPHNYTDEWVAWKLEHTKVYYHTEEEMIRQRVWVSNKEYIDEHNFNHANKLGYTLAMNQFGDLVRISKKNNITFDNSYNSKTSYNNTKTIIVLIYTQTL